MAKHINDLCVNTWNLYIYLENSSITNFYSILQLGRSCNNRNTVSFTILIDSRMIQEQKILVFPSYCQFPVQYYCVSMLQFSEISGLVFLYFVAGVGVFLPVGDNIAAENVTFLIILPIYSSTMENWFLQYSWYRQRK